MIFLDNKLVSKKKALISVFDHGFLYGDGIYETLRAYKGIVFKIDEHIERLFRSASLIGLKIPKTREMIKRHIYETMKANDQKDAYIRVTISRGPGPIGLDPELCRKPTFVIISNEFNKYPESYYKKGVKIAIVNTRRNFKGALDPQIKSLNFLNNVLAKIEAKKMNAYEAVMLNYKGYLAEGAITNIFFVKDRVVHTPGLDAGILNGITRRILLDISRELNFDVKEGKFRKEDIYDASEVFISNTTMEVMPVSEVDNIRIGKKPGRITKIFHKAYKGKVAEYLRHYRS